MMTLSGKIPIHISPFFGFIVVMLASLNGSSLLEWGVWSGVIILSILVHEMGHATAAIFYGQTAEIHLVGLGGLTVRRGAPLGHLKDFLVVLSGPVAGLLLCFTAYVFMHWVPPQHYILSYTFETIFIVNLFWSVFNVLPILPLDGGHLLRIFLEGFFGARGVQIAAWISLILAALGGIYFFMISQLFIGAIFVMFSFENYRLLLQIGKTVPEDTDSALKELMQEGIYELQCHRPKEALEKFSAIRDRVLKGAIYITATQYAARALAEMGQMREAFYILYPIRKRISFEYLLFLQQLATQIEEWEAALEIGEYIFKGKQDYENALINATISAILGQVIPSAGWLCQAEKLGFKGVKEFIQKREFDAVRNHESFQRWKKV